MEPKVIYKLSLNTWSLKGVVRIPGNIDLNSRDLKNFFKDAISAAAIREMSRTKELYKSILFRSEWPGPLRVKLKNEKDQVKMTIAADFIYNFTMLNIGFYLVFIYAFIIIPLQVSIDAFDDFNMFLLKQIGLVGVSLLNIIVFALIFSLPGIVYRRSKIRRYKRVFRKIATAFIDFKKVYDRMPPEKKDTADYQPEYAALIPQEEEGITLTQLHYQKKISWTFDINKPYVEDRISKALGDAGIPNSNLSDSSPRKQHTVHINRTDGSVEELDVTSAISFRHYTLGTLFRNSFDNKIRDNAMITPYKDHTRIDIWSYKSENAPLKPFITTFAFLAIFLIVFGYTHVIQSGLANPLVLGAVFLISAISSLFTWHMIYMRKIRAKKIQLESRLPYLANTLSRENADRIRKTIEPFILQWKSDYPDAFTDIRLEEFALFIGFQDESTAKSVYEQRQKKWASGLGTYRIQQKDLIIIPPIGINKAEELNEALDFLTKAIGKALKGEK